MDTEGLKQAILRAPWGQERTEAVWAAMEAGVPFDEIDANLDMLDLLERRNHECKD